MVVGGWYHSHVAPMKARAPTTEPMTLVLSPMMQPGAMKAEETMEAPAHDGSSKENALGLPYCPTSAG